MKCDDLFTPKRYLRVISAFLRDQVPESGFFSPEEAERILERGGMKASSNGNDHHNCPNCSTWPHCVSLVCSFLMTFEEAYPDLSIAASIFVMGMFFLDSPGARWP